MTTSNEEIKYRTQIEPAVRDAVNQLYSVAAEHGMSMDTFTRAIDSWLKETLLSLDEMPQWFLAGLVGRDE